ncbi:unnamed protein product [Anisakis simplex]|uniref:Homeobox domain-containing protein n=1 Tax=Anisakis simplex TaxID=6269 RepID=A0A0M3JTP0_ANISI|nr:unnamed protein product [Anisakis simplex]
MSASPSMVSSGDENRTTVIERNGKEQTEKATLLHEALSQASAVRAQKRKQKAMFSNESIECHRDEHSQNECSSSKEHDQSDAENAVSSKNLDVKNAKREDDVSTIKQHFLFPLLELMLKKCEAATWSMSADAFAMHDVIQMINEISASRECALFENSEIDSLLINTILMLRIHLIELLKVADLCNDFKSKYSQSLKKKMSQESMIGPGDDSDDEVSSTSTNPDLPLELTSKIPALPQRSSRTIAMLTTVNGMVSIPLNLWDASSVRTSISDASKREEGNKSNCESEANTSQVSFLNCSCRKKDDEVMRRISENNTSKFHSTTTLFEEDVIDAKRKCLLPSKAVDKLKSWLFLNASHPYPSEHQKAMLSKETGLQVVQINNWFINARRRILPLKLESTPIDNSDTTGIIMRSVNDYNKTLKRLRKEPKRCV